MQQPNHCHQPNEDKDIASSVCSNKTHDNDCIQFTQYCSSWEYSKVLKVRNSLEEEERVWTAAGDMRSGDAIDSMQFFSQSTAQMEVFKEENSLEEGFGMSQGI